MSLPRPQPQPTQSSTAERMREARRRRRAKVLDFVREFTDSHGYPPAIREVVAGTGTPRSTVAGDIHALRRHGYLRPAPPGISRALVIADEERIPA